MALDEERQLRQMKAIDRNAGHSKFWAPDKGEYKIRVVPGWKGSSTVLVASAEHFKIGPEETRIPCARATHLLNDEDGDPPACLVCDYEELLGMSQDKEDNKVAKVIRDNTSQKYYFNAYLPEDDEVVIWRAALTAYRQIMGKAKRVREEGGGLFEIFELGKRGYFFHLIVAPNTRDWYTVEMFRNPEPVGDERLIQKILAGARDLSKLIRPMEEKDIEDVIGMSARKVRAALAEADGGGGAAGRETDDRDRGDRGRDRDDDRGRRGRGRDDDDRDRRDRDAEDSREDPVTDVEDSPSTVVDPEEEPRGGGRGRDRDDDDRADRGRGRRDDKEEGKDKDEDRGRRSPAMSTKEKVGVIRSEVGKRR